jgi:hypothetical protein
MCGRTELRLSAVLDIIPVLRNAFSNTNFKKVTYMTVGFHLKQNFSEAVTRSYRKTPVNIQNGKRSLLHAAFIGPLTPRSKKFFGDYLPRSLTSKMIITITWFKMYLKLNKKHYVIILNTYKY